MEKMDPAAPINLIFYKFHDKPQSLAAAQAVVDIHPDFAKFMLQRPQQLFSNKSNYHALAERQNMFVHDPTDAYWYATNIGGKVSDEILNAIAKSPYQSIAYGMFTGERLLRCEYNLLTLAWHGNVSNAIRYVENVIQDRWPELERLIIESSKMPETTDDNRSTRLIRDALPEYAGLLYKKQIQIPKELMDLIKSHAKNVILYTFESETRHLDLEPVVKANPGYWQEYWDTLYRHTTTSDTELHELSTKWKAEREAAKRQEDNT